MSNPASLIDRIDAILPQTQCGQCGYQGCKPYAQALANGEVDINRCPPGGEAGIHQLAALLERPYLPFAPDAPQPKPRTLAVIDESTCIGCTLCLQACPVDAILGAAKQMHTVIADECTGCELCIAPCPVDCITMQPLAAPAITAELSEHWRERHGYRVFRIERDKSEKAQRLAERSAARAAVQAQPAASQPASDAAAKQAAIAAAMQRAAAQLAEQKPAPASSADARQAAIQAAMERAAARKAAAEARQQANPQAEGSQEQDKQG